MLKPTQVYVPVSAGAQSVSRPDSDRSFFGDSAEAAMRLLEQAGTLERLGAVSLACRIREFIHERSNRRRYVDVASSYLRRKRPPLAKRYDIVLVGAGMHAAGFLLTLRSTHPNLSVLVVERSSTICSTFARLGDSLVLNSPTFSSVGLNSNIMPGHFVQLSDFDELAERPFPTAKHLYELATMAMFHADADIAFDFEVKDVIPLDDGYQVLSNDHAVRGNSVVVANGLSEPATRPFALGRGNERIILGDDFISTRFAGGALDDRIRDQRVAVVGAGDTANCVIEYLLPMVYPHQHYGFPEEAPLLPRSVVWIGQQATDVKEFFFRNKQRYCHSGGVIEFFWDGDTPFDLSEDVWQRARARIECIADKLVSVMPHGGALKLSAGSRCLEIDLLIDCTGRSNPLSARLREQESEFVHGDIVLHGGQWDEVLEHFVSRPRTLNQRRLACKLRGERVFFVGSACPLDELIDDTEARNGSFMYQEQRTSLTNSKWSLEHTLPRTVALAQRFDEFATH